MSLALHLGYCAVFELIIIIIIITTLLLRDFLPREGGSSHGEKTFHNALLAERSVQPEFICSAWAWLFVVLNVSLQAVNWQAYRIQIAELLSGRVHDTEK